MKKLLIISLLILTSYFVLSFFFRPARTLVFPEQKTVFINDNGFSFAVKTSAKNIADFLREQNLFLGEYDLIIPEKSTPLVPGNIIFIKRAVKIIFLVDKQKIEAYTFQNNLDSAIAEQKIFLGHLDKVSPEKNSLPRDNMEIVITRINIEEKVIQEDIDFNIISNTDSKLGWREQRITQIGKKGIREVKYRITYKDGAEVSRVALEKNITHEPIPQIVTQGTRMNLGKANFGQGTWYAYRGGLFAASTSIPKGAYAKVTNTANGKSVIVQINDYGPQGKERIIDLDKVAFAKIASLGAGVIGVKVETILN